ncbi:nicotinamide riboside transporter PnuC [Pseudidiomarina halophila]|uniref:Nicotinamide riboside transporter PnuC n=1 Tax=Pseudidiomarina halophila TaxID=1449799 RepID=A0A432XTN0_9GAMM|nr:nicotinamide riboside transporter PnuC [Pseudidiomarina halophila]RUO52023.1 nicotinamide mononucleotide transporter [Pseudidiomarina halophila]
MASFTEIWQQVVATSMLEWLAVVLAIAYLVLAAHQSLWCWLAAGISCVIYTQLMFNAQLYMESLLQLIYITLAIYGWWQWRYGKGQDDAAEVRDYSWQWHLQWLLLLTVVAVAIAWLLQTYTDADAVWLDTFTTVFSLFATWLLTRKQFANWWYWLVIDAIYVYLYSSKGFVVTGALYFVYLILVVYAMRQWQSTQVGSEQCDNSG